MRIGLLAGYGTFPLMAARSLKDAGHYVVLIGFEEAVNVHMKDVVDASYTVSVGQVGKILKIIEQESVEGIIFGGKVSKELLYKNLKVDAKGLALLAKLKNFNDDSIMHAVVDLAEANGFQVLEQTEVLGDLLARPGVYGKVSPTQKQLLEIQYGYEVAKHIGALDIGQTVVVSKRSVMAVEAIDGTDATIVRGCALARKNAVIVKTAKLKQDKRFDVPTIGRDTMKLVAESGGKVIAVEEGATFILDMDECIEIANKNRIVFMSYAPKDRDEAQ